MVKIYLYVLNYLKKLAGVMLLLDIIMANVLIVIYYIMLH